MTDSGFRIQDPDLTDPAVREEFINDLSRFLGPYDDPREEMVEALNNALDRGFVFEIVSPGGVRAGAVVISRTPFRLFQPRYHLAYIATAEDFRGQGLGRALLAEAHRRTGKQLALHVSPSNQTAIAFYERCGWKVKYTRMMPAKKPAG